MKIKLDCSEQFGISCSDQNCRDRENPENDKDQEQFIKEKKSQLLTTLSISKDVLRAKIERHA